MDLDTMSSLDTIPRNLQITDLPQEIVDLIIDLLAQESKNRTADLHACNIVCKSFHSRAQHNLFEAIDFVVDFSASNRAHRLRRILEAKPRLISLVRSFKVIIQEPRYLQEVLQPLKKRFFKKPANSPVQDIGGLGSKGHFWWLLQTIASVHVVSFSLVAPEGKVVDWTSLSESSQSLFLAIRSSLRLKSLEVANISGLTNRMIIGGDRPNALVRQDSLALQSLTVRHCRLETSSTVVFDIPSIAVPFRHLKVLDLRAFVGPWDSQGFFSDLQSTLDTDSSSASPSFHFPALIKFAANVDPHGVVLSCFFLDLINSCKKTIECLELNVLYESTLRANFGLPRMRALQDLKFSVDAVNANITQPYLKFITRILRSASSPTNLLLQSLETIQLSIELERGNSWQVQTACGWEDLDKAIANQNAFPKLRQVLITLKIGQVYCYGSDPPLSSCFLLNAKSILPLTLFSGRVNVRIRNPILSDLNF